VIRSVIAADAERISIIYNHYIRESLVTFEEEPVTASEIKARIEEVQSSGLPWLVAQDGGELLGYAYAGEWKGRCAYRHSAEITVYLDHGAAGQGWGTGLYEALFAHLRERKIHVVLAGIALPNPESVALHEKFGMRKVAHFSEVGYKFEQWIDVGYWQAILN
jgi:phosphinothricin acetyltransferase